MTTMLHPTESLASRSTFDNAAAGEETLVVLHGVPGCWLEPTQTWLDQQIRSLPPSIQSHVITERRANIDRFDRPNVHVFDELPRWPRIRERLLRRFGQGRRRSHLQQVARQCGASVLHSHFGHEAWRNLSAARERGLKHVVTFYGLDVNALPRQGWASRYRDMFPGVDLVLCEGPHMAKCIAELGCNPDKIAVHHLGVDCERIPFTPRRWDGIEPVRFLIAASFREKKGIPDALEAVGRLRNELLFDVSIIGDAPDTPRGRKEKAKIFEAIERHHLESRVRMLGYQPHDRLMQEAREHHIFLSPSLTASNGDTEGGAPVALAEMLASGMPVLATRHCDIPNVVQHGVTGWLADERDVDGLATGLRWIVDHASRWSDMGRAGRARVEHEFNANIQGRRLANRYVSLTEGSTDG